MGDDEECCAICLCSLDSEHTTSLTGCGHTFHSDCIVPALQRNRACPLCRFEPGDESETEEEEEQAVEQNALRNRAIRSSLMRVNHGSASATAQRAAGRYRVVREALAATQTAFRVANREAGTRRRECNTEIDQIIRKHRRESQPLRRRWWACKLRLDNLEVQKRSLGDVLATEAGFSGAAGP